MRNTMKRYNEEEIITFITRKVQDALNKHSPKPENDEVQQLNLEKFN